MESSHILPNHLALQMSANHQDEEMLVWAKKQGLCCHTNICV